MRRPVGGGAVGASASVKFRSFPTGKASLVSRRSTRRQMLLLSCSAWGLGIGGCGHPSEGYGLPRDRIPAGGVEGRVTSTKAAGVAAGGPAGEPPIRVSATVGMVADLVREVGGGRVAVTQMMGSGIDPHLYRVTRDDVRAILGADLIVYNGLLLEGKMEGVLRSVGRRKRVVAAAELIDARWRLTDRSGGRDDPHVWMDASLWARCGIALAGVFGDFDPNHAADYHDRAARYAETLLRLHAYGRRSIGSIPAGHRVLITSHDAFHYFGRGYGIEVLGVQGMSTDSEAGLRRINELVDLLIRRQVPAVFVESSVPRKSIDALIEGAGARGHRVRVGGELYSDAMGPGGSYEGSYVGMMDHNITRVTRALGGTSPPRGWQGRLRQPRTWAGAGEMGA